MLCQWNLKENVLIILMFIILLSISFNLTKLVNNSETCQFNKNNDVNEFEEIKSNSINFNISNCDKNHTSSSLNVNESPIKIVDMVIYNEEFELYKFRQKLLFSVVDKFIVVHSSKYFTGVTKTYTNIHHLTDVIIINITLEHNNPWDNEKYTRQFALTKLLQLNIFKNKYILLFSDVDEFQDPDQLKLLKVNPRKCAFTMIFYYYSFKWRQPNKMQRAHSVLVYSNSTVYDLQPNGLEECLGGWHCSYCFDIMQIRHKLLTFSHTEYAKQPYIDLNYIQNKVKVGESLFDSGKLSWQYEVDNRILKTAIEINYLSIIDRKEFY
jgi:hypothetical protein